MKPNRFKQTLIASSIALALTTFSGPSQAVYFELEGDSAGLNDTPGDAEMVPFGERVVEAMLGFNEDNVIPLGVDEGGTDMPSGSDVYFTGDVDFFKFSNLAPGRVFELFTTGSLGGEGDSMLGIFNSDDELVAFNDDGGEQLNARIVGIVPSDGMLTVGVTAFDDEFFVGDHFDEFDYRLVLDIPSDITTIVELPFICGGVITGCEAPWVFDLDIEDELEPKVIDPLVAEGYDYEITGMSGNTFETIMLPILGLGDDMYDVSADNGSGLVGLGTFGGGVYIDLPAGTTRVRVDGIEVDAMVDPGDVLAFPTQFTFSDTGSTQVTQTPLTVNTDSSSLPEPSSLGLLMGGGLGAFLAGLRRRRKG